MTMKYYILYRIISKWPVTSFLSRLKYVCTYGCWFFNKANRKILCLLKLHHLRWMLACLFSASQFTSDTFCLWVFIYNIHIACIESVTHIRQKYYFFFTFIFYLPVAKRIIDTHAISEACKCWMASSETRSKDTVPILARRYVATFILFQFSTTVS